MANTYLYKTYGQNAGNRKTFTVSAWFKRSKLGATQDLISAYRASDGLQTDVIRFGATDDLEFYAHSTLGNGPFNYQTNRLFRDTSAWYHVVVLVSTIDNTASDRVRIYVNGVRETSFSVANNPSQNDETVWGIGSGVVHTIGAVGTANYFDGSASHIHYCDGYAYDANDFGETDATTGEWKIKVNPSVSYGTNGFFILKDGNSVTDSSPNSNTFAIGVGAGGGFSKTEDNPSNNFCTWNPNYRGTRKDMTLTYGNTFLFEQNSGDSSVSGTIAVSSGKYYWEQIIAQVNGTNAAVIGAMHTTEDYNVTPTDCYSEANTFGLRANGNAYKNGTNLGNFTTGNPNGDIFGIAFDADNGNVYYWRNGVALNSGNAVITGIDTTKTWIPFAIQHGGARLTTSTNFGNGYFANNPISSAGTNASGNGIFEYDVPTGFTALSTKGLNL